MWPPREHADAMAFAHEIECYTAIHNEIRPHEALAFMTPRLVYLAGSTLSSPNVSELLDLGQLVPLGVWPAAAGYEPFRRVAEISERIGRR